MSDRLLHLLLYLTFGIAILDGVLLGIHLVFGVWA